MVGVMYTRENDYQDCYASGVVLLNRLILLIIMHLLMRIDALYVKIPWFD